MLTKTENQNQVPLLNRKAPFMEGIHVMVSKEGVTELLKGLNPSKL